MHGASVLVLYHMSRDVFQNLLPASASALGEADTLALVAGLLHVFSPAGIFLSAPYSEALFSFLHFCGLWCYVKAYLCRQRGNGGLDGLFMLAAGALMGIATTVRSNGLLSGVLFACDAVDESYKCLMWVRTNGFRNMPEFRHRFLRIATIVLAGALLGLGFVEPQILAWKDYCLNVQLSERRDWCARTVPSIYAWVQEHYWFASIDRKYSGLADIWTGT